MGSAAGTISRVATGIGTFGLSELPGGAGATARGLSFLNPITYAIAAGARTAAGVQTMANAPRDAANAQRQLADEQGRQAAKAAHEALIAPKVTAPDDFLAMKNTQLKNFRLGLASTMTGGGGGTTSPSLLSGIGGKTKLG